MTAPRRLTERQFWQRAAPIKFKPLEGHWVHPFAWWWFAFWLQVIAAIVMTA